jgi:xanthine dehydrogenase iron-sulfur cluster and FAD-binding subunit A
MLAGHLCRCTGVPFIVDASRAARSQRPTRVTGAERIVAGLEAAG